MNIRILIAIFFIFPVLKLYAQEEVENNSDSSATTPFSTFNYFSGFHTQFESRFDSVFSHTFFYDKLKYTSVHTPRSGGPGSSSYNIFNIINHNKTIEDGFDQFHPYILQPFQRLDNNENQSRNTAINYHLASRKEQHIFIRHKQVIRPWFIAGLDFGASTSQGDFSQQLHTNRNFAIWMAYQSPSNVYRAYINFTSNRIQNEENGGISVDSVFENASSLDTRTLPVNLDEASVRHKTRDFVIKQDLNISKLFSKDSIRNKNAVFNSESLMLSHIIWWKRKSVLYTDQQPDSGYYNNYYVDSVASYDSTFYDELFNEASLSYSLKNGIYFGSGLRHQYVHYFVSLADTFINTFSAVVFAGYESEKVKLRFDYLQNIGADVNKGFHAGLSLSYAVNSRNDPVRLKLFSGKMPQRLRDRIYFSNHFLWKNNYDLMEYLGADAMFECSRTGLSLGTKISNVKNLVIYRADYLPVAHKNFVTYGEFSVSKSFSSPRFGNDTKVIYSFSTNKDVVSVPDFTFFTSVFYKNRFFKNALGFRVGADLVVHSSYQLYGYMPATGVYFIQNDKKTGNYPQVGLFLNLKIKSADLFLRLDHLNAGLGAREYYGAYHYPLPGRTVKFGVNWNLVD